MKSYDVAHLTSVHAVDDVRIYHKQCRSLAEAGYSVALVAPTDGEITLPGVSVLGVPRASSRLARVVGTTWRVYRRARQAKARLYHLHDPELIPAGLLLRLGGAHVLYDAHEDLPRAVLSKHWIHPAARRFVAWFAEVLETLAALAFSGVIAATPAIGRRFRQPRSVLVQNYPLLGELSGDDALPYRDRDRQAIYVGGISEARGANEMLDAFLQFEREANVRLVLVGPVRGDALHGRLNTLKTAGWLEHTGSLPRTEVATRLGGARIGLVLFHPEPNHLEAQPNKMFEYMSAGLPVIASHFPLWREIVESVGCGVVVDPLDPTAIAKAVRQLLDNPEEAEKMGERGRAAVKERFNWSAEATALLDAYERILK